MYMHMSSITSLRGARNIDCYLDDCCCKCFLQKQTSRSIGIHSFSLCSKVSCGLRQSALICSPRYRRVVGGNGYRIQKKRAAVIYPGQDRICRCLGCGEEEEEEEEEEACIGGLEGCVPRGEIQEMLSFLIEDRCRKVQGLKRREILRSSGVSGTVSGLGVVWKEKSCYAKRATGGRVGKQTSCFAEKENVGKGFEPTEFKDRWDKFIGIAQKESVKKDSLLSEKVTCQKSCLDTSLNGWKSRLNWISALESKNRRLNLICALELEKQEGPVEKSTARTGLEKTWNQFNSSVRRVSTVHPLTREDTIKKSTENFDSEISLTGSSRSTVLMQEAVHSEAQKIGPKKLLDGLKRNVQWVSAVKSQKQEEVIQESTRKSGFEVPSTNSKNMRQVSISHSGKEETSSLEKGESSGAGLGLGEHTREQRDQMMGQETVENTTEKVVFQQPDKLDLMEQTLQKERVKLVSGVSSDHSGNTARCSSDTQFVERETVENTTNTLIFQQQDELGSRKQPTEILQKERGKLVPGMLLNYSSEIAGLSSLTKLKEQERVENTTEKLVFLQQDELVSISGRTSSAKLEEERGITEENAKTASEGSGFLVISNRTSQKDFTESSYISGSSKVLSSGIGLDKKASSVDYEQGNKTSQKLFKTSSFRPVHGEASGSVAEKNKSTTSSRKANKTSQNVLQTSSYPLVGNGVPGSATEVEKMKSTNDHEAGSKISLFFSDLCSTFSSNEILGMATELEKKKYTTDMNTRAMFGKSASVKLSDESECSLEMFSAEGTENHGLTEKTSEESPPQAHNSQLSSGAFAAEGPSEEVWAIAGWSSREESKELRSSGNEKEENGYETLTSEEPSDKLQNNIAGLEEDKSAASKSDAKIIGERPSRGLWSSIAELCSKGWRSHEDSENTTMKLGSGRPSTDTPDSEEWFSVPELEDEEDTLKEKEGKVKDKISAKRQLDAVISSTGPSKTVDLKETESTQEKMAQEPVKKSSSESLDYSQLTRRRVSSAGKGHERQIRGKGRRLDPIADTKKTEGSKQVKVQEAAIQWVSEGSLQDELAASAGCVSSGSHEEHDCLERGKGKASLVNKDEIEEHEDIQRRAQSSETEEKEKMASKLKRSNQVPKETFTLWEEALILESEQRHEDEKFMREALSEARMAADAWEVPVGAVLVQNGRIIARAHNLVEQNRDATAHAEMLCIRYASNQLKTWRLAESTLYVTLEPCAMCAGAILQTRIGTVVWGAPNKLLGADGSWISLFPRTEEERLHGRDGGPPSTAPVHPFHPNIKVRRGVLASECSDAMQQFFKLRRKMEKKTESNSRFSPTSYHSKLFNKLHEMFSIFCL